MKRAAVLSALLASTGCVSIEHATVVGREFAAPGEPIAVLQADIVGLSLFLNMVPLVNADLDTVVNKVLIGEAKAMGGTRVELKEASTTPTGGVYALFNCLLPIPLILCARTAHAVGVVIK